MADSSIAITAGSGTLLHSETTSIASATVHNQVTVNGEYARASYTIITALTSIAVANDHILAIQAGATLNVRIRRITIEQGNHATAAALVTFALLRTTTAGTGGTVLTPAKLDTSDAASGATAMTLPTAKGTESTEIRREVLVARQAILATATQPEERIEWDFDRPRMKSLVIAAGTTNGIAIKCTSGAAAATVLVYVEFCEMNY